jgi:hypothetical protein
MKSKLYWKEEEFQEIGKFNVNRFRGNKQCGPWDRMQEEFVKLYGLKKAKDIYPRLYLRREEYEKIEKYVVKWAQKYHPHYTKKQLDAAVGMYDLQYSPCSFYENPSWTKKGVFYIKRKESK